MLFQYPALFLPCSSYNVSLKCGRKFLNINFFLYIGIQITWYLHSRFAWFRLWILSIESLANMDFGRFNSQAPFSLEKSTLGATGNAGEALIIFIY